MEIQKHKGHKAYMIAALGVAVVGILLYAIVNVTAIKDFISRLWVIFGPVVYGFCIAYLCNPIMRLFDNRVFHKIKFPGLRRALSLVMTTLVVLAIIALLLGLLIPEIFRSVETLVTNYDNYLQEIANLINNTLSGAVDLLGLTPEQLQELNLLPDENNQYVTYHDLKDAISLEINDLKNFFTDEQASRPIDIFKRIITLLDCDNIGEDSPNILRICHNLFHQWFPPVNTVISGATVFFIDIFFSILIAIHLLATKETRLAQIKKIRKAIFTKEQNKFINNVLGIINRSFGSYIEGKLLDSFIIFVLCLVAFWVFGISEYFVLIAVLIGITDFIPVVGPLIGAIPGGFIILITNPSKLILYIILVLLIQQLEGNIISPKILGDQMGVSALCVLISIVVMGTIFEGNPVALILSVPMFAVMVEVSKLFIEARLQKKGLPTDLAEYYRGNATDDEIDFATHYQNKKLKFFYEHSKLKKHLDKQKEQKQLRKLQKQQEKQAAGSVCTDVTDQQTDETAGTEQEETTITKE